LEATLFGDACPDADQKPGDVISTLN